MSEGSRAQDIGPKMAKLSLSGDSSAQDEVEQQIAQLRSDLEVQTAELRKLQDHQGRTFELIGDERYLLDKRAEVSRQIDRQRSAITTSGDILLGKVRDALGELYGAIEQCGKDLQPKDRAGLYLNELNSILHEKLEVEKRG